MNLEMLVATIADTITDRVLEKLSTRMQELKPRDRLLTPEELAEAMRISVATVKRHRRAGMPFVPVDHRPRFELAECIAWFRARAEQKRTDERAPRAPRARKNAPIRLLSR